MEKWAPGITAIEHADLGESPAAVNRETGVMYINPNFKLTSDQWYFIMLHEMGHLKEQTKDELTADAWAHKQYLKESKRSLKESVFALTDLLTFQKDEDFIRARYQLERAKNADSKLSMYTSAYKYYGHPKCDPDYSTYFIGGKKPKPNPIEKNKLEYLFGVDDALIAGGISLISNIFGGGKPEDTSDVGYQKFLAQKRAAEAAEAQRLAAIRAEEEKKKTLYWIIGGIIVAIVIAGTAFLIIKKK